MTPCRHCEQREASYPRVLCWRCYRTPGVRELHPPVSKYGCRGVGGDVCGGYDPPPVATDARPGTPDKIAALARRAEQGCALWHRQDGEAAHADAE